MENFPNLSVHCHSAPMRSADFAFDLPAELIAQQPAPTRDGSRLLVIHRKSRTWEHRQFREFSLFLRPGDLLVFNDSRVIPARLRGVKLDTGGAFEILLLEPAGELTWWCLARPGKGLRPGTQLGFVHTAQLRAGQRAELIAQVIDTNAEGHRLLRFEKTPDVVQAARELGETPLPPYIERSHDGSTASDHERYQTIYAREDGSVAAPTAGLHFEAETLAMLAKQGVELAFVTLHVGLGTFAPVKVDALTDHVMHEERYHLSDATAAAVNRAKAGGRRVIAVGTTSARVLESAAMAHPDSAPGVLTAVDAGRTRLFLYPPATFRVIDGLLTNFHLSQSTLLMLVCSFAAPGECGGRELILRAYAEAVRERYRFFSYGDAMLLV